MRYTIERLVNGDEKIAEYYKVAKHRWNEILEKRWDFSVDDLAKVIQGEQFWFEHNCGGRYIGQEVMVVTGITQFYSTAVGFEGNEQKAVWVYDAIMASYCSMEVKFHAERVAKLYNLREYADHD